MLKPHHKDHNTCENQSSWLAQSLKQTFFHKLLNLKTFFTNYFYSRPFSQIGFVSDLPHKLVGLWTFLAKKFPLVTFASLKKTHNTRGNFLNLELKSNFEFVHVFFAFWKCTSCLLCSLFLFLKPSTKTLCFLTLQIILL